MPRGSTHQLTGLLVSDPCGFALEVEGGGRWRLDVDDYSSAARLRDRRVTVMGVRAEFDLLEVKSIIAL